ncbi:hypothetical protein [Saccharospirillum mangrovi]|uniref:hypothetical protein n=1 Tax=Saccharospirillum mangrovi TaxID=2161747 RepID=UPI000D360676|nr:hypothetical protein [Saccharospirillum mangrovi]
MSDLHLYAGRHAFQHIQQQGLKPNDIRVILGASGGPKCFVLTHLDRYLVREWLPKIAHPLQLVGSSIGALRMTAYANTDPFAAIERLETGYLNQRYSEHADADEITDKTLEFIDALIGDGGFAALHPQRQLHIVSALCKGPAAASGKHRQAIVFGAVALANALSRRSLPRYFERVVFRSHDVDLPLSQWDDFHTHQVPLSAANYRAALHATAAIPVVIHGVDNPPGAPLGLYRDGGMVDYHFDLPFKPDNGIVLYPHFSPVMKPGWFDKPLPWRKISAERYSHTLVVTPSPEFIARLPYGKIPDRKDFERLSDRTRLKYWLTVVDENQRLADAFDALVNSGELAAALRPIEQIAR